MVNTLRNAEKERHWRQVLGRQASSGLSVRAFCQREQLTESAFYAWRRTIGERDGETTLAPSFVPMVVTDQGTSESSIAIELSGGHVLRLPASTPAAWVAELVLGLEGGAVR
jgi:transposase-like protein